MGIQLASYQSEKVALINMVVHMSSRRKNVLVTYRKGWAPHSENKNEKINEKHWQDNKTAGGRWRLADVMIDKTQNYYGQAIRNNQDLYSMKNVIWTIVYHVIRSKKM